MFRLETYFPDETAPFPHARQLPVPLREHRSWRSYVSVPRGDTAGTDAAPDTEAFPDVVAGIPVDYNEAKAGTSSSPKPSKASQWKTRPRRPDLVFKSRPRLPRNCQ